jgi:hypothetical protein
LVVWRYYLHDVTQQADDSLSSMNNPMSKHFPNEARKEAKFFYHTPWKGEENDCPTVRWFH